MGSSLSLVTSSIDVTVSSPIFFNLVTSGALLLLHHVARRAEKVVDELDRKIHELASSKAVVHLADLVGQRKLQQDAVVLQQTAKYVMSALLSSKDGQLPCSVEKESGNHAISSRVSSKPRLFSPRLTSTVIPIALTPTVSGVFDGIDGDVQRRSSLEFISLLADDASLDSDSIQSSSSLSAADSPIELDGLQERRLSEMTATTGTTASTETTASSRHSKLPHPVPPMFPPNRAFNSLPQPSSVEATESNGFENLC